MASTTKKWLIGCGAGCGVVILVCVLLGVGGVVLVKKMANEFEQAEAGFTALKADFGELTAFRPWPDGTIPAARLDRFLAVRRSLAPAREEMNQSLAMFVAMKRGEFRPNPLQVLKLVKNGIGLVPAIARFYSRRNEILRAEGMGLGEYHYLYVIIYYSWLGFSPADGPPFTLVGNDEEDEADHDIHWEYRVGEEDEVRVRQRRDDRMRCWLNPLLLDMMRHQLDDLEIAPVAGAKPNQADRDRWRETVTAEIAAMQRDEFRLPWEDGVPAVIENSLDPYRDRLAADYDELCNPLELGPSSE